MQQCLEKYQCGFYLAAVLSGLGGGLVFAGLGEALSVLLWPLLAVLLYATFTQVPLLHLRDAFLRPRFLLLAVIGNFLFVPLIVWCLLQLAPPDAAVQLGILLVLLVPCTDWFITFTQLGGGDTNRAIAFSPISLLLQMLFLPFYLWLFMGSELAVSLLGTDLLLAFVFIVIVPLLAAVFTEKWAKTHSSGRRWIQACAWLPVPLLTLVVFVIAVSQVQLVMASVSLLGHLLLIFLAFLLLTALLARLLAGLSDLSVSQGRALAFSFGTRNSFVVLPLALALPASFEIAVVVIVFQSLVELFGMMFYLWWLPRKLFPG